METPNKHTNLGQHWYWNGEPTVLTCPQCGNTFDTFPSHAKRRKYCSKKCHDEARKKRTEFTCPQCGKIFSQKKSRIRYDNNFCSHRCYLMNKATTIEKKLRNALQEQGIEFIPQYKIGKYCVDVFIPSAKLAIECDGSYWHKSLTERDAIRDKFISESGITVIRFPEIEINENLSDVIHKITSFISLA